MASTRAKPFGEQRASLLPDPMPASELGQSPPDAPAQHTMMPKIWRPPDFPRRMRLMIVLLVIFLLGGTGILVWALRPAVATITVTPAHLVEVQSVTISTVTGKPKASGQIQARSLFSTATRQTSVPTTGVKNLPELVASGKITFYNALDTVQTVNASTILTSSTGVQVKTLAQAVIPPASGALMGYTTVDARAILPGSAGNIPVHAISINLGPNGSILARNETPFQHGQEAAHYRFVQQSDIDQAAAELQPQAKAGAKTAITAQVTRGDLTAAQQCTANTRANPSVGAKASVVQITVTASCHEESYTPRAALSQAATLYRTSMGTKVGPSYALSGRLAFSPARVAERDRGALAITYVVRGIWVYQLDLKSLQRLVPQVLGKRWSAAQAILREEPGVAKASLSGWNGTILPTERSQIAIQIAS